MTTTCSPSQGLKGDKARAASPQGLSDRGQLALIALERTRMPMVVTDPRHVDNPIILANQAFLDLCGYTADEVIGRNCRFLQGPDTDPAAIAAIRQAIATEREVTVELYNYRKDGTGFWNQLWISPIHDDAGRLLYFFGSQLNSSETHKVHELERAERRLLKEVDHRAMNVLALVQAITRLTKADDPKHFAESVRGRVQALANAHTLLAEQGWKPVALRALIDSITQYAPGRVALGDEDLSVSATLVQPLAIVLHELMANTLTHGALSAPDGALHIGWTRDEDKKAICLDWRESGGPAPASLRHGGFGFSMIKAVIERQLRGRAQMNWHEDGLHARLSFPDFRDGEPVLKAEA